MSRDDGFAVADIDSSKYDDAKMRALWQFLRDESKMARATCLHDATLLASWRHGERLTVREACPLWLAADDEIVAALVAARLIGKDLKVSPTSWKHWYGSAITRREVSRAKGRLGGLAKAERARGNSSPATAQLEPGSSPALPVRPSDRPTDRQTESTDARADLDAFLEVRFRAPTPAQRTFLDGYVQTFDQTGPARAARLILSHPDDPIGALKADLAAFRDQRRAEAAASEVPKPAIRRARQTGVSAEISKLWREQEEQREQERLERMAAGGAA